MLEQETPYLSIHIPRTGGTSLHDFFWDVFGPEKTFFYYPYRGGLYKAADESMLGSPRPIFYSIRDLLIGNKVGKVLFRRLYRIFRNLRQSHHPLTVDQLPHDMAILHGHFEIDSYRKTVPKGRLVTVIREPLDRATSNYRHLRYAADHGLPLPPWFNQHLGFKEFIYLSEVINYQSNYLQYHQLDEFMHVGTTSCLPQFCSYFDQLGRVSLKRLNETPGPRIVVSRATQRKFRELNTLDYALYEAAYQRVTLDQIASTRTYSMES